MESFYFLVEVFALLSILVVFLGSMLVRLAFRAHVPKQDFAYVPSVTVIMSCFNEGRSVYKSIETTLAVDYPRDKLHIVAIDDCSKDDSWEWMQKAAAGHSNITVVRNDKNLGKSKSLLKGLALAKTDLILNIDSDGELEPRSVKELSSCFVDPGIGAVGGSIMIRNSLQNWLTQMQTLQYNTIFQTSKVGETFSNSVNCISGALFMIRRELYNEIAPIIDKRSWLGIEVREGEDRFMTNLVLNLGYKTIINNRAKVYTEAPSEFGIFFSQQLRWRRGFFRTFLWIIKPHVISHKVSHTSSLSIFKLYMTALLTFIIPALMTWTLITQGIVALVILKFYLIAVIGLIHLINYLIAKHEGDTIKVKPFAFFILPLWTIIDMTLLTALAACTLTSSSWETRVLGPPK